MKVNLYLENKNNLLQTEELIDVESLNIDDFRIGVMDYLMDKNISDIKYDISVSKNKITNKKELDIIFEKDTLLLREFKLIKLFEND
jgi:hypothetical protein